MIITSVTFGQEENNLLIQDLISFKVTLYFARLQSFLSISTVFFSSCTLTGGK